MITTRRHLAAAAALLLLPLSPGEARAREITTRCDVVGGVFQGGQLVSPHRQEECITYDKETGETISKQLCSYRRGGSSRCEDIKLSEEEEQENANIRAERRQAKPAKPAAANTHKPVPCLNYVIVGSAKQCLN